MRRLVVTGIIVFVGILAGVIALRPRGAATAAAALPERAIASDSVAPPIVPSQPVAVAPGAFEALAAGLPALLQAKMRDDYEARLTQLAKLDPRRTLDLLNDLEPKPSDRLKDLVLGVWMHDAPRLALAWAQANRLSFFAAPEYLKACFDLRDISLVDAGVMQMPDGQQKNSALQRLTREWAKVDPAFMSAWTQGLVARGVPGETRDYAMSGVLEALAREAPDEAIRWVQQATPTDNNTMRRYYQAVARGMTDTGKLEAAEKFFGAQRDNPDYNLAFNQIVQEVAKQAPERVDGWLKSLAGSFAQGSALGSAVGVLSDSDPAAATRLFSRHAEDPNGAGALRMMQRLTQRWAQRDRAAALQFIEEAPRLTAANRQRLRDAVAAPH